MTNLNTAKDLAEFAHYGQKDKTGTPYIEHVRAVAEGLRPFGPELEAAGWLHDIIEDTEWTEGALLGYGIPAGVVRIVVKVSNLPGEDYKDRIGEIITDPQALLVKVADNAHNSHPDRVAKLDEPTRERLGRKYCNARKKLWPAVADPTDIRKIIEIVNRSLMGELHQFVWESFHKKATDHK